MECTGGSLRRTARGILSAALITQGVLAAGTVAAATRADVAAAESRRIRNGAEPAEGTVTLELKEVWRIGEPDDDLLLGLPTRVAADAEGRIYVLDSQLDQVHVLAPDGKLLETRYRSGSGPGELRNSADLVVFADGATGVLQEFPGQVVRLDREGSPLPTLRVGGSQESGGNALLASGCARGGRLVLSGATRTGGADGASLTRNFLSVVGDDGRETVPLYAWDQERGERRGRPSERDLIPPSMLAWDVAPDGRAAVALDWDAYEILVTRPDGSVDRIIQRDYEPWKRTPNERRRVAAMLGARDGDRNAIEVSATAPTIAFYQRGLHFAENGDLYVHTSRGNRDLPDGILARYDVFDREGSFRRQVNVLCEGDPWNDRLVFLPGGRVVRIRRFVDALVTSFGPGGLPEGDAETPAVICYEVVDQGSEANR